MFKVFCDFLLKLDFKLNQLIKNSYVIFTMATLVAFFTTLVGCFGAMQPVFVTIVGLIIPITSTSTHLDSVESGSFEPLGVVDIETEGERCCCDVPAGSETPQQDDRRDGGLQSG